ncbi:hypothetical protein BSPWISOXPB_10537 [uncultured Gammaproteobacteria bacterium]|nr:hypothetical protein BSPWISOXPB_10537 [uncultured Gammaproteobacteria bacterium]
MLARALLWFLHTTRAANPRWFRYNGRISCLGVDRTVIKLRTQLNGKSDLTPAIKKKSLQYSKTFNTKYHYRKRKMRLESILQRQVYHLAGYFSADKNTNLIGLGGRIMAQARLHNEVMVAYDIEDSKNRTKLFKKLKDISLKPIQKSVFWGI